MSTNFYIVPSLFGADPDNMIPVEWIKQVHIAQSSNHEFLLQAVRGNTMFENDELENLTSSAYSAVYHSPVDGFPTIETWEQWKNIIENPDYTVVDEYDVVVSADEFIHNVENTNAGSRARFDQMTEWRANNPYQLTRAPRSDYLDPDGFSFEVREFF